MLRHCLRAASICSFVNGERVIGSGGGVEPGATADGCEAAGGVVDVVVWSYGGGALVMGFDRKADERTAGVGVAGRRVGLFGEAGGALRVTTLWMEEVGGLEDTGPGEGFDLVGFC